MISSCAIKTNFNNILDKVIVGLHDENFPIVTGKNIISIGDYLIIKENNTYSIVSNSASKVLYSELFLLDAACAIAKFLQLNDDRMVSKLISLERDYVKYYMDMKYYRILLKAARKCNDVDTEEVMEDRYQQAFYRAQPIKEEIRNCRNRNTEKR